MNKITEREFTRIWRGIQGDRDSIIRHNPIGTAEETLLWMLLSCLISYLSLTEIETPCFSGTPDAETYRKAILYILSERKETPFSVEKYLDEIMKK